MYSNDGEVFNVTRSFINHPNRQIWWSRNIYHHMLETIVLLNVFVETVIHL